MFTKKYMDSIGRISWMSFSVKINKKLLPMKMHFFIGMAGGAPIIPFLSTISKQRGYSSIIVGLIFTLLPFLGLLVRPAIGAITDVYKCRKVVFALSIGLSCASIIVLMFIPGSAAKTQMDDADVIKSPLFWLYFCTVTSYKITCIVNTVMEDTICINILGEKKNEYGHQRMWGSIGWGTMSIISGVCVDWFSEGLDYKNYTPSFIISLIFNLLDLYVISKMPIVQNKEIKTRSSDIQKVLSKIKVLSFLLWVVAHGIMQSFIWNFVFWYMEDISNIYHPETKPYIKTLQGLSLTIQCFGGEVPFFFLSNFILKRVGHMNAFSLMFMAFTVRFYLYSIITNPVWVLPVELLNGITYALGTSTAVSYVAEFSPVGAEGTLQGIVGMSLEEIGVPIGSSIGGYLFNRFDSITSFKYVGGFALTVCISQTIFNQLINRFSRTDNNKDEVYYSNSLSVDPKISVNDILLK